jgi:hypothetical protein
MRIGRLAAAVTAVAAAGPGGATAAAWSEPLPIAATPRPTQTVAVGIAGSEAIAAWEDYRVVGSGRATDTTDYTVWAAAGAVGVAPGAAQRLDRGVASDPLPTLATSASGYAAIAWIRDKQARVAVRPPGGAFGAPIAIASVDVVGPIAVGIDDAGTATVLWNEFVDGGTGPVRATTVPSGGAPAPAQTIGSGSSGGAVDLAVDGRGDAVAAWGTFTSEVQAALRPAAGAFGTPTTFADPSGGVYAAGVTLDPDGRATLALVRHVYTPLPVGGVGLVQGTPTAGWSAPQWLDAGADILGLKLAAGGGGHAALWDTQHAFYPFRPGVARTALAAPGQPFAVVGEEVEAEIPALSSIVLADRATDVVRTGGGETLALWTGTNAGVTVHPLSAAGQREPNEPLLADACVAVEAKIAAGPGAQAAALFLHRRRLWISYRAAGVPARPRPPRICALAWRSGQAVFPGPVARAGRIDLYVRVSKPIARLTVEVRRGTTVAHRRVGPRPTGYVRVRLPGRGGAPRLSSGRYRVTVRAVDRGGRQAVARAVALRVTRARDVSSAA